MYQMNHLKILFGLLFIQKVAYISALFISDSCQLPLNQGKACRESSEYTSRYYYDYKTGGCLIFSYAGCKGNNNNFVSYEACVTACKSRTSSKMLEASMRGLILDISDVDKKTVTLDFESGLSGWKSENINITDHQNDSGKSKVACSSDDKKLGMLVHNFTADPFSQVEIDFLLFVSNGSESENEIQFQIKLETQDNTIEAVVFDLKQFQVSKGKWHELRFLSPLSDEKTDFRTVFQFKSSDNKNQEIFIDDIEVRLIKMMDSQHLEHDPFLFKKPASTTSTPTTTTTSGEASTSTLAATTTVSSTTSTTTSKTTANATEIISSTEASTAPTPIPTALPTSTALPTVCNCSTQSPTTEATTTITSTTILTTQNATTTQQANTYFPGNVTTVGPTTTINNQTTSINNQTTSINNQTTTTSAINNSSSTTLSPTTNNPTTPTSNSSTAATSNNTSTEPPTTVAPGKTENLIDPGSSNRGRRAELVVLGCLVVVLSLATGFILFKYIKLKRSIGDYRVQSGSRQTYNNPAYSVSSTADRSQASFSS